MIFSKTKDQFNKHYDKSKNLLQNRGKRQMKHESSLREFESFKETYVAYILCKKRGTRGKHVSSISKSNHSSILVHLNKGVKNGNLYYGKPQALVQELFFR